MSGLAAEVVNIVISLLSVGLIHRQAARHERREGYTLERMEVFDVLKGICIIGVVLIHAAYLTPFNLNICRSLDFAVPFFFIASGFLLSARFKGSLDLRSFYGNLFFRVVLVYILFVAGTRMIRGQEMTVQELLLDALLGRTNYNYYFIPLILQFYALFPLLIRFRERLSSTPVFSLVALFSFAAYAGNHYVEQPYWNSNPYYLVFIGKDFSYFCFGIFLSLYDISRMRLRDYLLPLLVFLAGAAGLMLLTGEYQLSYAYPFAAFILAVGVYYRVKGQRWLRIMEELGRYSLVVYLAHSTIQRLVVMTYVYNETRYWGLELVLVAGSTVIISYGFARAFMAIYNPAAAYCLQAIKKR
jgi:peptidoglycan/LPS O-acetylase OafA/YrhL